MTDPEPFPSPVELGEEGRAEDPSDRAADAPRLDVDRVPLRAPEADTHARLLRRAVQKGRRIFVTRLTHALAHLGRQRVADAERPGQVLIPDVLLGWRRFLAPSHHRRLSRLGGIPSGFPCS